MKHILLILCPNIVFFALQAQTFTQNNEPSIGDTRTYYLVDSNATSFASNTGTSAVWNYSTTPTYVGQTRTITVTDATTSPHFSDFTNATKVIEIQNYVSSFFSSTATERISQGYLVTSGDLGIIKAKFSNDPEKIMDYPTNMNGTTTDIFSGNISFTFSGIPQNPACTGNSVTKFDGVGTLFQVNGVSLSNVSRFHIIDTTVANIPFIGVTQFIRNQFEYYDLSSTNRLPVFLHSNVVVLSGFPDPLMEMSVILSSVPGNGLAHISELDKNEVLVYPNPIKNEINLLEANGVTALQLFDMSGRAQKLDKINFSSYDVRQVADGIYILKVERDGKSFSQRVEIKK